VVERSKDVIRFLFGPPEGDSARFYTRRTVLGGLALAALLLLLPLCFADRSYAREVTLGALAGLVSLLAALAALAQMRSVPQQSPSEQVRETSPPAEPVDEEERAAEPSAILYGRTPPRAARAEAAPVPAPTKLPLAGVDMRSSNLAYVALTAADLSGSLLREADLREADLRKADLHEADLRGSGLVNATLEGADLDGADLRGADLRGADLRDCSFRNALIDDRTKPPEGVDLRDLGAVTEGG
jgi:hypothetical protein